jgi:hypothetical protein
MMHRVRIIGLTLLALAVPQIAFGGEDAPTGPATLSVSASLDGCGLAEAAVVCRIDVSWSALDGADYYSVSVTRPDGSVIDAGQVTGTSRSVFVPYVGSGTYSVQVAAWGTPPGEEEPKILAREKAMSTGGEADAPAHAEARPSGDDSVREGEPTEPAAEEPDEVTESPGDEEPACLEPSDEPEDGDEPAEDAEAEAEAQAPGDELAEQGEDEPPVCP